VRRKKLFGIPITNLAGATDAEGAGIEGCNAVDSALFGQNSVPKICAAMSDASDRANPGNDGASSTHAVTVLAWASTYAFIQRNVLFAMW
jgi:hypothetical protein